MKLILLSAVFCLMAVSAKAQTPEKSIRDYLMGFEKKDWNSVASQFADGFTFTSPAGDDHISLATYKEKCFVTSQYFKKVEFSKIMIQGNSGFAIYNITTTDDKIVRNTEYYTFENGKIKSIECFFGPGIGYPGKQQTRETIIFGGIKTVLPCASD